MARNPNREALEIKMQLAIEHIVFCAIGMHQVNHGRLFLHEHPAHASSLDLECVNEVMQADGVGRA